MQGVPAGVSRIFVTPVARSSRPSLSFSGSSVFMGKPTPEQKHTNPPSTGSRPPNFSRSPLWLCRCECRFPTIFFLSGRFRSIFPRSQRTCSSQFLESAPPTRKQQRVAQPLRPGGGPCPPYNTSALTQKQNAAGRPTFRRIGARDSSLWTFEPGTVSREKASRR